MERLWEQYDISLSLQIDVNILLGINGSGKSTLLKLIEGLFSWNVRRLMHYCKRMELTCNDGQSFVFDWLSDEEDEVPYIAFRHGEHEWIKFEGQESLVFSDENKGRTLEKLPEVPFIRLSTFDSELKEKEAISKLSNVLVRTELDWQLWKLEKKYLAYQLTVSERIEALLAETDLQHFQEAAAHIRQKKQLFERTINQLFVHTGKKIGANQYKELIFKLPSGHEVTPYELSSGEKQILIILLRVLMQDSQPYILLLDEPEVSMHLSWQVDLIDLIRQLNPHCQVLIATHAPAVLKKGWKDKILKMDDIVCPCAHSK